MGLQHPFGMAMGAQPSGYRRPSYRYQPATQNHYATGFPYNQGSLAHRRPGVVSPYSGNPYHSHYGNSSSRNGGFDATLMLMLASIRQMMRYIKALETERTTSTETGTSTGGTSTTTKTGETGTTQQETPTETSEETQVTTFEREHLVNTLAEKHVLDMSNGTQELTIKGQNNSVFAINNKGANTYKIEGKKNDLVIESFDADDTIILDDSALNYTMDITKDGTIKLKNQDNDNTIELAVDAELINADDERETLKNVLSRIQTADGETFWDVVEDQNFNPDKSRSTVTQDIGKSKQDKKMNDIDGENTHFILNDVKAGAFSKARQDNIYNLTGHQNIYEVNGDHGANRFVMNNTASQLIVKEFGGDDSLQFISPKDVDVISETRVGNGWEIKLVDNITGSEIIVKTKSKDHKADFVKERMGAINEDDGLSKSRANRTKRNTIIKAVAGVALVAAGALTFGGTAALGGSILGSLGITGASAGIATAVGAGVMLGANAGINKLTPANLTPTITDLGAELGSRPAWLAERLNTENLTNKG